MDPQDASILTQSIVFPLSQKRAPGRILKSPQSEYACSESPDVNLRGRPTPRYEKLYEQWSTGRLGMISTGNIMVHRDHCEAKTNPVIDRSNPWDPVAAFAPMIRAAKAYGSLSIPQLSFPGRQAGEDNCFVQPLSASDVKLEPAMGKTYTKPRPMTKEEIDDLIERFKYGAEVLYKAGADGCQIHASHGYIFTQFLAPRTNKRTDEYGGSYENRSRLLKEVVRGITEVVPLHNFILSVKANCQDFIEGGVTFEEIKRLIPELEDMGVDHFDISGGVYEVPVWRGTVPDAHGTRKEGYFVDYARQIKPLLKRAVLSTTGGFRTPAAMADAIRSGACDMVGVARPLRMEPGLIVKMLGRGAFADKTTAKL